MLWMSVQADVRHTANHRNRLPYLIT